MIADIKPYPPLELSGVPWADICSDIVAPKKETEGLIDELLYGGSR
jgi:hypothetical protein